MRRVKSFVRRSGRLTNAQQNALDNLSNNFLLSKPYDFKELFDNTNPIVLEIGFGNGKSLVQMASDNQQYNYIGIEVYLAGVGSLINDAYNLGLNNLKVINDDAIEALKLFPNDYFSRLQLYFPDPWHKKKHNKRRIVNSEFLDLIIPKLKTNSIIHMATDWEEYACQMLEVLNADSRLKNLYNKFSDIRNRPSTKFETRGKYLGHDIWDLEFSVVK